MTYNELFEKEAQGYIKIDDDKQGLILFIDNQEKVIYYYQDLEIHKLDLSKSEESRLVEVEFQPAITQDELQSLIDRFSIILTYEALKENPQIKILKKIKKKIKTVKKFISI